MPTTEPIAGGDLDVWTPEETARALDAAEITLIDVRTPNEHAIDHIAGALLAPMAFLVPRLLPPQGERPIVLHCGSGVRSRKVAEACLAAGLGRIAHMAGGIAAWKQAGLPYIATDPATGAPIRK